LGLVANSLKVNWVYEDSSGNGVLEIYDQQYALGGTSVSKFWIQWGVNESYNPGGTQWFNFPVAFPNGCVQVVGCDSGSGNEPVSFSGLTATGCNLGFAGVSGSAITSRWLAIGW
jgi:hypothetical protein